MKADPKCDICKGTGIVPTLDIWSMAEVARESPLGLNAYQDASALPMITDTPCAMCREDDYREIIDAIYLEKGNPFAEEG